MRLLKLTAALLLMFSASGCAIHGCSFGGKLVCDPDGTNCRWETGFDCKIGPPYPDPTPYPPAPYSATSALATTAATIAASYGESDTDGDGILSCEGVYWVDTDTWEGSCH